MRAVGRDAHPWRDLACWPMCSACACDIRLDAVVADRDAERHAAQTGEHAAAGDWLVSMVIVMAQALPRCALDGGADAMIRGAPTNVPAMPGIDVGTARRYPSAPAGRTPP